MAMMPAPAPAHSRRSGVMRPSPPWSSDECEMYLHKRKDASRSAAVNLSNRTTVHGWFVKPAPTYTYE